MIFDGFTHILFDFDGTLCESELDIRLAWKATFPLQIVPPTTVYEGT